MRILWLNWKDRDNPLAGGAEVVNEELAKRLVADGHEVTFVVAGFKDAAPEATRHGFHIIRVGSRVTVYWAAWRWYRQYGKGQYDLVIDECNTVPFFAGHYAGVPTVLFFHMLCREIWFYELPQPLSSIGWLIEPLYLRLLKKAPIITVSQSTKADLTRRGFSEADIHIISEGIELPPVQDLAKIPKYERPTVLSLGAGRAMKRTLDQIRAFELAKPRVIGLQMKLAGDMTGTYGKKVLAAVAASPFRADIEVLGKVTPEQKLELMQHSHLLMVTSIKEGWGLVVTEAASQGTPAVVYDVDGLRDSVQNGITGLIAADNTPSGLADLITGALSESSPYEQLREAAWQGSKAITFERSYADFTQALKLTKSQAKAPQADSGLVR